MFHRSGVQPAPLLTPTVVQEANAKPLMDCALRDGWARRPGEWSGVSGWWKGLRTTNSPHGWARAGGEVVWGAVSAGEGGTECASSAQRDLPGARGLMMTQAA